MKGLLVGVCVNGKIRRNGYGYGLDSRKQWGITNPETCEKCDGKGCAKEPAAKANAEQ